MNLMTFNKPLPRHMQLVFLFFEALRSNVGGCCAPVRAPSSSRGFVVSVFFHFSVLCDFNVFAVNLALFPSCFLVLPPSPFCFPPHLHRPLFRPFLLLMVHLSLPSPLLFCLASPAPHSPISLVCMSSLCRAICCVPPVDTK